MKVRGRRAAWCRRVVVVLGLSGGLIVAGASSASAHAVLEHTSPASGAVLKHSPTEVTLTFGEDVGVNSSDVQVFDDKLHRIDKGDAGHLTGHGETVGVDLPPNLRRGTYTVTWRVISADSHPVAGGFTFSVGAPSKVTGTLNGLGGGSRSVGILLGAMRFLGYAGLIAGPGGLVFLLLWPAGRRDRRSRQLIGGGLAAGALSSAGLFLVQAPYAQGESLAHIVDGGLLNSVAHSHFGRVLIARLILWLILAAALALVVAGVRLSVWLAAATGAALPVTWAIAGHGDVGSQVPLALASESLHVLAVTVWIGGLLVLTTRLLRSSEGDELFDVLPRFSTLALCSVSAILVTGLYQAWREIGVSWAALITTTYGRLVLAKVIGIVVLIGLGAFARRSLSSVAAPTDDAETHSLRQRVVRSHLRHSVFLELELGVAILVLTSILVNTIPAKEAVVYNEHRNLRAPGLYVETLVTPGHIGSDTITLSIFTADGYPRRVQKVTGYLGLPAAGIASLPVDFAPVPGTNELSASVQVPRSGQWQLSFEVQESPINATQFTTTFTVH